MRKLSFVSGLLVSVVLAGCATAPKPELDVLGYQELARGVVALPGCATAGYMTAELAALGEGYLKQIAGTYSYSTSRLNAAIESELATPVTKEECTLLAMRVYGRKQKIEEQKQFIEPQTITNTNKTTQTICNKIGTQLFCNTY